MKGRWPQKEAEFATRANEAFEWYDRHWWCSVTWQRQPFRPQKKKKQFGLCGRLVVQARTDQLLFPAFTEQRWRQSEWMRSKSCREDFMRSDEHRASLSLWIRVRGGGGQKRKIDFVISKTRQATWCVNGIYLGARVLHCQSEDMLRKRGRFLLLSSWQNRKHGRSHLKSSNKQVFFLFNMHFIFNTE